MKKFGALALLLALSAFAVGCEKPKDKAPEATPPADGAPAETPAETPAP